MSQDDLSRPINELIAAFDDQERILKDTIMKAVARLDQVTAARRALLALESDDPLPFDGKLADAIRVVLKTKNRSLVPVEVRDQAKALGYDFAEHKNQMAAVHGVLKRMVESGEAKTKEWSKQPGVTRYYWSGWDSPAEMGKPLTRDVMLETAQTAPKLNPLSGSLGALYTAAKPSVFDALKPKK